MQTITLNHLSKKFKGSFAVDDITCSFEKGKIYGLLGRNGAGKSTLLRMMSGRLRPSSGEIHYDSSSSLISPYSQAIYHTEPTTLLPEIKIRIFSNKPHASTPLLIWMKPLQMLKPLASM